MTDTTALPLHTIPYGDHPSQFAELTIPPGDGPFPVVVVVHGGVWLQQYGLEYGQPIAADLAASGVAAYNVEYRRIGGDGGWPITAEDVLAAVLALPDADSALVRRLDLDIVVVLGHSAGAQLALWTITRLRQGDATPTPLPRLRILGAVTQGGMLDLVDAAHLGIIRDAVPRFLGGSPEDLPQAYAEASPIAHLPLGVPVVCVHGDADPLVPISQSERYVRAATAAGDRATLRLLHGVDHFQPITPGEHAWQVCRDEVFGLIANG
jgi:acetyl esterase/lipase